MLERLAGGCLVRIWMRLAISHAISVGWPAAEEPAFDGGLGAHRRADPGLDAVAFAFTHPAVEAHDNLVRVGAGVDGTAYLGYPELNAVVDEHRESEAKLVPVEGSLGLTDNYGLEGASWISGWCSRRAASGRLAHGRDRDSPMSKNSMTISPRPARSAGPRV